MDGVAGCRYITHMGKKDQDPGPLAPKVWSYSLKPKYAIMCIKTCHITFMSLCFNKNMENTEKCLRTQPLESNCLASSPTNNETSGK